MNYYSPFAPLTRPEREILLHSISAFGSVDGAARAGVVARMHVWERLDGEANHDHRKGAR